jgi:hypothetical protein
VLRVPSELNALQNHIRQSLLPVYLFGADIAGKVVMRMLSEVGIRVEGFIDNNKNKCATPLDGVEVHHAPEVLGVLGRDAVILIASTYIADIIRQLEDHGYYNWAPITGFLGLKPTDYYRNLLSGDLRKNHAGGEFTKDFDIFVLENMFNSQIKYLDNDKLYIRSVDLIVTERCSLKCKDCSNLMQYYESPVDIGTEELMNDVDDLCSIADEINEIRIIGGDPLMNKDFDVMVRHAAGKPNVNKVVVYTNGTIAPPERKIAALADEKVFIFITTYGELSRRTDQLKVLLDKFHIPYNCQPAYGWTDCADISKHGRLPTEQEHVFRNCCAKHFTTLTDGKMFRCPFGANLHRLSAMPDVPDDYFEIRTMRHLPADQIADAKSRLRWYLREKAYIEACDFCNGRTYGDPEITPGLQTKHPITYLRHEKPVTVLPTPGD